MIFSFMTMIWTLVLVTRMPAEQQMETLPGLAALAAVLLTGLGIKEAASGWRDRFRYGGYGGAPGGMPQDTYSAGYPDQPPLQ